MSIFTSKKVWKYLIQNHLTKIWTQKGQGVKKWPSSCQLGLKLRKIFHYLISLHIVPLQFHALLLFCKLHQIFSLRLHIKSSERFCSKILLFQGFENKQKQGRIESKVYLLSFVSPKIYFEKLGSFWSFLAITFCFYVPSCEEKVNVIFWKVIWNRFFSPQCSGVESAAHLRWLQLKNRLLKVIFLAKFNSLLPFRFP